MCPWLEDFVTCKKRTSTTKGLNELPLIGGLCLVQWTSTAMANYLQPSRVSVMCSLSEDFVTCKKRTSTTKGLNELPLIGGLCLVQRTSTAMAN